MEMCDRGHGEVCYDGPSCPACALLYEMDEKLGAKRARIETLEDRVLQLEDQLENRED